MPFNAAPTGAPHADTPHVGAPYADALYADAEGVLEPWRLDDAALAEAYAAASPAQRACVKHCLALLHTLWGEGSDEDIFSRHHSAQGFAVRERSTALPWSMVALTPEYSAPTRLAAALMPAILAKVPRIWVFCVGGSPSLSARVTLELAGIEDIFVLPGEQQAADCVRTLYGTLKTEIRQGAVLLLPGPAEDAAEGAPCPPSPLAALARFARAHELALWQEFTPPRLVHNLSPSRQALLDWCHPDALPCLPGQVPHAVYGPLPAAHEFPAADLTTGTGMEGFWKHAGLDPNFFRRRQLYLSPLSPPQGAS